MLLLHWSLCEECEKVKEFWPSTFVNFCFFSSRHGPASLEASAVASVLKVLSLLSGLRFQQVVRFRWRPDSLFVTTS